MPDLFVAKTAREDKKEKPHVPEMSAPGMVTIQKREMHPFATFHIFPEGIIFENQEKDEVIYLMVRRHLVTNLPWVASSVFFALLPIVVFLIQTTGIYIFPEISFSYLLVAVLFYYLILFGYSLVNLVSWFYNIGIVTQLRIIDIDLNSIQHKHISATILSDIVDVSYSQKGFLQSFFDYGDVRLQTEGFTENFEFFKIPHPAKASDIISDLIAGREIA